MRVQILVNRHERRDFGIGELLWSLLCEERTGGEESARESGRSFGTYT